MILLQIKVYGYSFRNIALITEEQKAIIIALIPNKYGIQNFVIGKKLKDKQDVKVYHKYKPSYGPEYTKHLKTFRFIFLPENPKSLEEIF